MTCRNMLRSAHQFRCIDGLHHANNECKKPIEHICSDCGYKQILSCNICLDCHPDHDYCKLNPDEFKTSGCYDCAMYSDNEEEFDDDSFDEDFRIGGYA